jgi:hypothetical protein
MVLSVDPCRCPLCGHPNACAMEASTASAALPCWCTRVHFGCELLQQLPTAVRGKACICQACAQRPTLNSKD